MTHPIAYVVLLTFGQLPPPLWLVNAAVYERPLSENLCRVSLIAIYIGAVAGLFYTGNIRCGSNPDGSNLDCPIVPIVNLSKNQETSMSVAVMTLALFGLVFLTCCHIFLIALQKLRVRFILYGFIEYSHNFASVGVRIAEIVQF